MFKRTAVALLIPFLLAASPSPATPTPSPSPTAVMLPVMPAIAVVGGADEVKLEIPLAEELTIEERVTASEWRLILRNWRPSEPEAVAAPIGTVGLYGFTDPTLGTLTSKMESNGLTLSLPWKYGCPTAITWLESPRRLAITIRKTYKVMVSEDVAPGVRHDHVRIGDASGPQDVHVLRVAADVRVAPALARNSFSGRETVSAIAKRYGAIAGINGGYFSPRTGEPLGLVMIDGELVAGPLYNRSILAIGGVTPEIGRTQLVTRLKVASGESYGFDGVNQPRGLNRMVLYTARFGPSTFTPKDQAGSAEYVLLPDGTVLSIMVGDAAIPPGGMVISAQGQAAEWLSKRVSIGDKLAVRSTVNEMWPGAKHLLGGGPTLVDDGQVRLTTEQEQFKPDIAFGRAPRTAAGIDADGRMMLVTVDGRQPRVSQGLTLEGMAKLMRDLGARDAINFDGGGSTAMAIDNIVVNHPSDGAERRVNTALLVFPGR